MRKILLACALLSACNTYTPMTAEQVQAADASALLQEIDRTLHPPINAWENPWSSREQRLSHLTGLRNRIARLQGWPDDVRRAVENDRIALGMTRDQVVASWGWPQDVNRTITAYGTDEQWCYGDRRDRFALAHTFVYFVEGRVQTIQD